MSDPIKHECGIALVRLRKNLQYYQEKYDSALWGFNQLFLLMEKQHNRGQDGAGMGCVKLDMPPGEAYMFRERDNSRNPISTMVKQTLKHYQKLVKKDIIIPEFPQTVKDHFPFGGEVLLGHLRYGTSGGYDKSFCQPYFRKSPWATRNLMIAGNFNMTNVHALNARLVARGAHPIFDTDTQTVLEEIGYHLDEEHQRIYHELRDAGVPSQDIAPIISERLDPIKILSQSAEGWDGGYVLAGMIGNGDSFVMRDPNGIRPAFYIANDEVVAFASERAALMTIFNVEAKEVREVQPAQAIVVKKDGRMYDGLFTKPQKKRSCSFERIYFSRGNDPEIYAERKALGAALSDQVLKSLNRDFSKSVFSYIPNTAEVAFYGFMSGLRVHRRTDVKRTILEAQKNGTLDEKLIDEVILSNWPRGEKIAHKDIKLRTFISQETSRVQLASHVYDITYGVVGPEYTLVCMDDSIVRGTTLRRSILRILARTNPKKIIVASTAPQIRYPDCYGIDMSELGRFIAFQAAIALCRESGADELIRDVYEDCIAQADKAPEDMVNHVKRIYDRFTTQQISTQIAKMVYPKANGWKGEVEVIFQTIENLHKSCPNHTGDWYFTGNYPTAGGYLVLNRAFINYYEKREGRSY